mgnify:CR=1 FL=1
MPIFVKGGYMPRETRIGAQQHYSMDGAKDNT